MPQVRLTDLTKIYGLSHLAVDKVNIDIADEDHLPVIAPCIFQVG